MADINVTVTIEDAISISVDTNAMPPLISQAEAEAGTGTGERVVTAQRIFQAITAWMATWVDTLINFRIGNDITDGALRITGIACVDIKTVAFDNPLVCDCALRNNHNATITGDTEVQLDNLPEDLTMSGMITLLNDGSGGHAVTFGTGFDKQGNGSNDYDATASKYNWINWYYNGVVTVYSITNEA